MDILFELFIAFRVSVKSVEAANTKNKSKQKYCIGLNHLGFIECIAI